jgi:hypothetical protein
VNGQAVAQTLDRFAPEVAHDLLDLGVWDLKAGVNQLQIELVGAHEKAIKRHMFGLDYLKLEKR